MPAPEAIPHAAAEPPDRSATRAYALGLVILAAVLVYQGYFAAPGPRPTELVEGGVHLETATAEEIALLPGFGPARAQAVVEHRTNYGPVTSAEELDRIPGVGPATAERARPYLAPPTGQVEVLTRKQPPPPPAVRATKIQPGEPPIDVNAAPREELMRLPGVGATIATRMVDGRPYNSLEDLGRVKGVGEKTLANLRPFVKISPP